ncbi:hypothetical protein EJB05_15513, partial [Eragrostis curvula]
MADVAFGSLEKIVKVALAIKEAVETVKQNDKECRAIKMCATRCTALLKRLEEQTDIMKDEAMRGPLEDVAESLEEALELVKLCQRKHCFSQLWKAGDMAKELRRVQDDIVRKIQVGDFAAMVQATVMLTNFQNAHAALPPPLPPPPLSEEVVPGSQLIDWSSCFRMIQGIAQGIHYLHEQCVVRTDLKPSNILLDSDMNPLISDFGVATKGYMATEYLGEGILSTKCDVYAFGMILNQTISSLNRSKSRYRHFVGWAELAEDARRMETFGPAPAKVDQSQLMEIKRCIEVGSLCTQFDRHERPTMTEVLQMLSGSSKK